ncbi:MAG: segregation/condensation protein A [Ignavibacteriaceae bacterium]|nr:segregation/condensation protein A [Ignavibacteriaceae bacterium]
MYKVKLNQFEGPLDLLLFFIKRDELNIYDIPIAKLTKEFLEYVNLIKILDLEVAGDFILMASTLMHIKVRMLLPREIDEKGDEIDPRAELVRALLEYKRYKEMSEELSYFESSQRRKRFRGNFSEDLKEIPHEYNILLKNVSIYDLAKAFRFAIEQIKNEPVHQVKKLNVSIEEQMEFIENKLEEYPELHFLQLIENLKEKIRIIVTFVALLEMIKVGRLIIKSTKLFNDFIILKKENG